MLRFFTMPSDAGLDMGIVNAGQLAVYEEIPKDLLELVEDVLLNRRPDATERLVDFAEKVKSSAKVQVERRSVAGQLQSRNGFHMHSSRGSSILSKRIPKKPGSNTADRWR